MADLTSRLLVKLVDGVSGPARKAASALLGLGKVGYGAQGFAGRLNAAIERNNAALDRARGRMMDAVAAGYMLQRGLAAPINAASEFESAMADVAKVVDFASPAAFKQFQASVLDMSKRLPMAAQGLSQIVAAAGQAGIAQGDLLKFTEMAAKVGVAFDISADQTGDALAKMMTGLDLSIEQVGSLADAMNHLSNAQASSAADILDVVRRVGATSKQYGFSAEQVSAFASAMLSAGMQSEVVATSFRNMGLALTRGASATKRQRAAFKELGLDAVKVSKAMQHDAVGTTMEVLEAIGKLPKDLQASLSSDLFGNEARALGPLLSNLDLLKKSLGLVADETQYAGSATREYEVRSKTFANAMQLFRNKLNALAITIGNVLIPPLTAIMDKLGPIVERFQSLAERFPKLTRNVIAATAALIGFRIAASALTWLGLMGRGGALSMLALGFNTVGKAAIAAKSAISDTLALQTALAGGQGYTAFAKIADSAKALVRITPGLRLVGPAIGLITGALGAITLPMVAGVAAVAAAGFLIVKYWDRATAFIGGFASAIGKELAPALEYVRPVLDWLAPIGETIAAGWDGAVKALQAFGEWIGSFFSREVLNDEQKAQWAQSGHDAAVAMIDAIKAVFAGLVEWAASLGSQIGAAISGAATSAINSVRAKLPTWAGGIEAPDAPGLAGERAGGGPVYGGRPYLVGEQGPEIVTPARSGYVHPNGSLGGGGGAPFKQTVNVNIHGVGNMPDVIRQVRKAISDETERALRAVQGDVGFGLRG